MKVNGWMVSNNLIQEKPFKPHIYIYIYTCSYSPLSSFFRCHSIFFTRIFHCLHLSIVDSLLVLQFGFFMKPVIALDALCRLENELHCFHLVMPSVTYHMKQAEHRISLSFSRLTKKISHLPYWRRGLRTY